MAEDVRRTGERPGDSDDCKDPLGELIEKYDVELGSVAIVSGTIGILGAGLCLFGLMADKWSTAFFLVGGAFLALALFQVVVNVLNLGRCLELRKRGLRFIEGERKTEMAWGEIEGVDVDRTDDTYMGPVSVERRSSDPITPSGPLTKSEWQVTIRSADGRSIRLSKMFFRMVSDPKKLISHLRMRSGVR